MLPADTATATPATVKQGETITVTGGEVVSFDRNVDLTVELRSHVIRLGSARSDANGRYNTSVRIPTDAEAGAHRIVVTGTSRGRQLESIANITVIAAQTTPGQATGTPGTLPRTGWSPPLLMFGLALGLVGLMMVRMTSADEDLDALAAEIFGTG